MGAKPITIQQSQIKTDKTSLKKDHNSLPLKNDRMPYQPIKPIILEKPLQVLPEEELPLLLMMASFEQFILDENKTKNRKLMRQKFLLDMRKVKHRSREKSEFSYDSENKSNFTSLQQIRSRKLPIQSILKPTNRSITQYSKNKHVSFEYRRINTERQFY